MAVAAAWPALALPAGLSAAPATFDGDAAVGTAGDNVTWANANNWTTNGVVDTAPSNTAPGDDLTFGGGTAGGVIDLGAARVSNSLTFNKNYTLGLAATALALTNATGNVSVASGTTATVNAALNNTTNGLTLTGGGTLVLGGINTFAGTVNINAGVLEITGTTNTTATLATDVANKLGAANNPVSINGGTLRYNSSNSIRFPSDASALNTHVFTVGAAGGTFDTPNGQFEVSSTANSLVSPAGAVLTKTGAGTLRVASANANFLGTTVVNAGVLESGAANSFGTTQITVNGGNVAGNGDLGNPIVLAGGAVSPVNADRTFGGTVNITAASSVSLKDWYQAVGRNLTLSNALTGSGGLTVNGIGTGQRLTLSGNNTAYTGAVTVSAGHNVSYTNANSVATAGTTVNTSATALGGVGYGFDFGATVPTFTNTRTGATTGGVFGVNATLAATTTLNLATLGGGGMFLGSQTTGTYAATTLGADGTTYRLGGGQGTLNVPNAVLADNGGATGLVVGDARANGGGTVVLGGASTFTGSVAVNSGTLSVATVANGGTASGLGAGTGAVAVGSTVSGQLTYTGGTASTNRAITLGTGTGVVNVSTAATNLTFNPAAGSAITSTTGPLTKAGTGTLTLGGTAANTVTVLTMNGGTLDIGANNLLVNNAGGNTVKGTVNSTINATGGGAVVISTAGGTNFGDNSVSSGVTLTINAKVSGADNTAGFEYCCDNPGGTIVLNNPANDFVGNVIFNAAGTVAGPVFGLQNAVSSLGKGTSVVFNTAGSRLQYTGTGETTDRILNFGVSAIVDQSGPSGLLKFSTSPTISGANAKTITLQGSTAGTAEFAAVIPDNSTTNTTSVAKLGTGTWTLSAANTFTGITDVTGGVLNVTSLTDYGVAGPLGARLAASETATGSGIGLHINGGTLQYTGATPQTTNRQIRIINGTSPTIDASGSTAAATVSFTFSGTNTNLFDTAGTRTLNLVGSNTGRNTFAIQLTDQATNATSLTKNGTGTWALTSATSNFTGGVTITQGSLIITTAAALGTGTKNITLTNGTAGNPQLHLDGTAGNITLPATFTYATSNNSSGTTGAFFNDAGNNTIQGTITPTSGGGDTGVVVNAGTLTISAAVNTVSADLGTRSLRFRGPGNGTLSGLVTNGTTPGTTSPSKVGIVQEGTGVWSITGNGNTYNGATTVTSGTLLASNTSGSATGTSAVTVSATGIFGGAGFVTGPVTAGTGGTVSPGAGAGTLTITGTGTAVTFNDNSTLKYEIGATPAASDLLNLTGTTSAVAFGGPTWNLNISNIAAADTTGQTYVLVDYTGTNPAALPTINFTGPLGGTVSIDTANTRIVLTNVAAVPEPAAVGLLGLGAVGLLARRRRSRAR